MSQQIAGIMEGRLYDREGRELCPVCLRSMPCGCLLNNAAKAMFAERVQMIQRFNGRARQPRRSRVFAVLGWATACLAGWALVFLAGAALFGALGLLTRAVLFTWR